MRIACIGFGSLISNPGSLNLSEPFQPGGPMLHLEFSHVALDGRLTLIIDEANGTPCPTQYAIMATPNLNVAIRELQAREGLKFANRVGWKDLLHWMVNPRCVRLHAYTSDRIGDWADGLIHEPPIDAVIWTASYPNFHLPNKAGEPFSLAAVQRYLDRLPGLKRVEASSYAAHCPPEVVTPARPLIEFDPD